MGKEELADRKKVELSKGTKSDHLMFANVMMFWEDSDSEGHARDFCWKHFLSDSTLRMLDKMKGQFAEHLHASKFLSTSDFRNRACNRNSGNEALVKAIIAAGLYPNVAKAKVHSKNRGQFKFVRLKTRPTPTEEKEWKNKKGKSAKIHPKSVNAKETDFAYPETDFAYPWMVFHQIVRSTGGTFLHDCTSVSPLSLAFFGQSLSIGRENVGGQVFDTVSIDRFVKLNCQPTTSKLTKRLRSHLDELLEHKISYPGVSDWSSDCREGALLQAIVELLSSEVQGVEFEQGEGEEEDD